MKFNKFAKTHVHVDETVYFEKMLEMYFVNYEDGKGYEMPSKLAEIIEFLFYSCDKYGLYPDRKTLKKEMRKSVRDAINNAPNE